jgi:molecular chaperone GrpE
MSLPEETTVNEKEGDDHDPVFSVIDRRPVISEDGTAAAIEPRFPTVVEDLKARAEEAERRAREISVAYRRIDEERDAFRERLTRDLERRLDIARAEMMRKIIGVLDDLDRAIAAAQPTLDPAPLLSGVIIIRDRLLQILGTEGVEVVETSGRPFDPSLAEAVVTEPTDDPAQTNIILEEMERGYTLRGTLLRPARVKVARARNPADTTEDPSH